MGIVSPSIAPAAAAAEEEEVVWEPIAAEGQSEDKEMLIGGVGRRCCWLMVVGDRIVEIRIEEIRIVRIRIVEVNVSTCIKWCVMCT